MKKYCDPLLIQLKPCLLPGYKCFSGSPLLSEESNLLALDHLAPSVLIFHCWPSYDPQASHQEFFQVSEALCSLLTPKLLPWSGPRPSSSSPPNFCRCPVSTMLHGACHGVWSSVGWEIFTGFKNMRIAEFLLWLSGLRTWHCLCENVGSIPGLTHWAKDPGLQQAVA